MKNCMCREIRILFGKKLLRGFWWKGEKKLMQFAFIFYLFSQGRPMIEYEQMQSLFTSLKVPNNPFKHWNDYAD
jgi:hypothetical protein